MLALSRLFSPPGFRWRRNTCPLLLFFIYLFFFLHPTPPDITPLLLLLSWCVRAPLVLAPVSCQVSSLLALSVSQRSDKSEPGVGLSLPLATEVSFSPSIIHILFNLTRWKWPRSVRTSSEANAGGFFSAWGGQYVNYRSDPQNRNEWNDMSRLRHVDDALGGNFRPPYEATPQWQQTCRSCAVFSCLKRENANHCYINCIDTIGLVLFCLLLRSFALPLHTFFFFFLGAKRLGGGGGFKS